MGKEDSSFQALMSMQRTCIPNWSALATRAAMPPTESRPALNVATVYQDPLTRHWAAELWDRVGQLIGLEDVRRQSWKISDLTIPEVFTEGVQAAIEADVLVVSVRDAGEWPMSLHLWIDAWLPRRAGRAGALVALIGVPGQPDEQSGHAHKYLETVARQGGLDFLPQERKLPEAALSFSSLGKIGNLANTRVAWPEKTLSPGVGAPLRGRLNE